MGMKKKIIFSENEYVSIRTEMIERIKILNSQSFTALATIISFWTIGFTVKIALMSEKIVLDNTLDKNVIEFLSAIFFLIPIFLFISLSVKSGENLTQIASLSAYIRVFYEYPVSNKKTNWNWETSNNLFSNANIDKKKKSRVMKLYNEEYTILSSISLAIYITLGAIHIKRMILFLDGKKINYTSLNSIIILYIMAMIIAIIAIGFIHNVTSMKKTLMKSTVYYVRQYIKRANEIGVIKSRDLEKAILELDPLK